MNLRPSKKIVISLFLLCFVVFNLNLSVFSTSNVEDTFGAKLLPFQLLSGKGIFFDEYQEIVNRSVRTNYFFSKSHGHVVSNYPLVTGVLALPVYVPGYIYLRLTNQDHIDGFLNSSFVLEKISASIISSLTVVFVYLMLSSVVQKRTALLFALFIGFASQVFSIASQMLWQQTGATLFVALSMTFLVRKRYFWALFFSLVSFWARVNMIMFAVLVLALIFKVDRKNFSKYLLTFGFMVAVQVILNSVLYGTFLGTPASPVWAFDPNNFLGNLAGVLFSPGRGALFYTPYFLVAIVLGVALIRNKIDHYLKDILLINLAYLLGVIILTSVWGNWWGGGTFGDRLLLDAIIPTIFVLAIGFEQFSNRVVRYVIVGLMGYAFFIQVLGVFYYPRGQWDSYPAMVNDFPERNWDMQDNPILRNLAAGIDYTNWFTFYSFVRKVDQPKYTKEERRCRLEIVSQENYFGYRNLRVKLFNLSTEDWLTAGRYPIMFRETIFDQLDGVRFVDYAPNLPYKVKANTNVEFRLFIPKKNDTKFRLEIYPFQLAGETWSRDCRLFTSF